jgi:hypothetical protein
MLWKLSDGRHFQCVEAADYAIIMADRPGSLENQRATVYGGAGAVKRIRQGKPFIGLAREVLSDVLAELGIDLEALDGVEGMLVKRAARFEATARMFDAAADSAAADGELDRWERYQQRAGWIGSKAFSALSDVRAMLAERADGVIQDAIEVAGDD